MGVKYSVIIGIIIMGAIFFALSWFNNKLETKHIKRVLDKDSLYTLRINKLESKIDSVNLLNNKKDSILSIKIDSLKNKYTSDKEKLKRDENKYINTKSGIFFPEL